MLYLRLFSGSDTEAGQVRVLDFAERHRFWLSSPNYEPKPNSYINYVSVFMVDKSYL